MTDRKTLKLSDTASDAPPTLNKKGRGWKISDKRLDALHDRAREMKRFATPAHKALAERFAKADLGRHTFKRHAVVGSAIVDFNCHSLGMAVDILENDDDPVLAKRRDKSLEAVGIRVMRVAADDVLNNMDAVLARITAGMRMRIADKREARASHFDDGGRDASRGARDYGSAQGQTSERENTSGRGHTSGQGHTSAQGHTAGQGDDR
jgi:very-short-patch-repair endonuclease